MVAKSLIQFLAVFVAMLGPVSAWAAENDPLSVENDPIFQALTDEVARAQTMNMSQLYKPYWVGAYAQDIESFDVSASFGALLNRQTLRRATVDTQLRLGSFRLDNTNFTDDAWSFGGRNEAGVPAEPNYDALRHALWLQFDRRYKKAIETLSKKHAFLETSRAANRPDDFAPAPVTSLVLARQKLAVDEQRWTRLVKKASAVFRNYPQIHACRVALRALVAHQYFVSSDKVRHRFSEPLIHFTITATVEDSDGVDISQNFDRWAKSERDLPGDRELIEIAQGVAKRLDQLSHAPTATEDYTGPVLFTGRAASLFFLATLGEPLSRPRSDLGNAKQGRLVDRLGKRIASKLITARDDPTLAQWQGQPLIGHFPIDDDSVKPLPITLVEEGILRTYYMSRVPTKQIAVTNGHSRNGEGAVGSLFVESKAGQNAQALRKRLLELIKEEDLDYGLIVEDFETNLAGRSGHASGAALPAPATVWRLWADGRQELVRGMAFKPLSFRVLKEIDAVGDQATVVNTELHGQRTSVVAPAALVKILELQQANTEHEKPLLTPRPTIASQKN